jgi:uncharacterized protein
VTLSIEVAGWPVELLPARAMFLPQIRALVVADVHWGKAASFRALGVPVPHGTTQTGVARLSAILRQTGAAQLIVLGDLFHARSSMQAATISELRAWREEWPDVRMTLVRGNHDYRAGDPPPTLEIACVDAPLRVGPFALHHHPTTDATGYVLAGHVHPVAQLRGRGRARLTLPCFAFGASCGVLPAFGEFTGGAVIAAAEYDRIFVVAEDAVVRVPNTA